MRLKDSQEDGTSINNERDASASNTYHSEEAAVREWANIAFATASLVAP